MKTYEVRLRITQTLVYHVEANSAKEAAEIANSGDCSEAYEGDGHVLSTKVRLLKVSKD